MDLRIFRQSCFGMLVVALLALTNTGKCQSTPAVAAETPNFTGERLELNYDTWLVFRKLRRVEAANAGSGVTFLETKVGLDASQSAYLLTYAQQATDELLAWSDEQREQTCVTIFANTTTPGAFMSPEILSQLNSVEQQFRSRLDATVAFLPNVLDSTSVEKLNRWSAANVDKSAKDARGIDFHLLHTKTMDSPALFREQSKLLMAMTAHCQPTT